MRRSWTLPKETTAAISVVIVAALVAMVVLVRHATEHETVQAANRAAVTPEAEDPTDGVANPTTTTLAATPPTDPVPPTTTIVEPTTTTTTQPPSASPPAPPPPASDDDAPECPGLVSETYWTSTGDRSVLVDAAGGTAGYTETVTNGAGEPCTLSTNRCGSTVELRTGDGHPTDQTPAACSAEHREEVLQPGAQRTEQLSVTFQVPPGDYLAHIRRYDGTTVDLPVTLDDRLAACPPDALTLQVAGQQQGRDGAQLRDSGLRLGLVVAGAAESCTVRVVESRLRLDDGEAEIPLTDDTDRWLSDPAGVGIHTHLSVPPTEVPPGQYEGLVTLVLESGDTLTASVDLLVR